MYECEVSRVPEDELSAFANSLFSYLYFQFEMTNSIENTSRHFREAIGKAVLCLERNTCMFNNDVITHCETNMNKRMLCQKICNEYPNTDYFRKLYFISAFILDIVLAWHRHLPSFNLGMGPDFWMEIFRTNFESTFEINGGFQRFSDAGQVILEFYKTNPYTDKFCTEYFLPKTALAVSVAHGRLTESYPEISTKELLNSFESLSMKIGEVSTVNTPFSDLEARARDDQPADKKQTPFTFTFGTKSPVVSPEKSGESSNPSPGRKMRKRRLHSSTDVEMHSLEENVDRNLNPYRVSMEGHKVRIQELSEGTSKESSGSVQDSPDRKSRLKRRHDSPTTDSDPEADSPSKAKVDRK